jgi:aspartate/methionine/tyrosine aminotransferase
MVDSMSKQIGIRELAERAKEEGAYDLAQGVIDTVPPAVLIKVLRELPIDKISSYNNKRGVMEYREAVVKYLDSRGWKVDVEQVLSVAGAMGGITSALLTGLRPGAKVLLPEPFFVYHKLLLETLGFEVEYYKVPLDKQPDWEEIEKKMSKVDSIILTTPANPTGQVASIDVLKRLSKVALEKDCLLIIDEMYREFIWNEETPDDGAYKDLNLDKTVIVRSFSKTYAIPGWRIGFVVTSPERVEKMSVRHDALYIGGSTVAQNALAGVLNNNLDELSKYVTDLRVVLQKNMRVLAEAFKKYGFIPLPVPATYYMLLKHNDESDLAVVEKLLTKKIAITPANIFYSDSSKNTGYIRIHFGVTAETTEAVIKILDDT